jgi:hypothetical protein
MYTGYYMQRSDGDGELIAVVSKVDTSSLDDVALDWLELSMGMIMNEQFGEVGVGWFTRELGTCDFPDIWDNHEKPTIPTEVTGLA